jgi:hypothetical protein
VLVISAGQIGENAELLWVMMITSAENRGWAEKLGRADSAIMTQASAALRALTGNPPSAT